MSRYLRCDDDEVEFVEHVQPGNDFTIDAMSDKEIIDIIKEMASLRENTTQPFGSVKVEDSTTFKEFVWLDTTSMTIDSTAQRGIIMVYAEGYIYSKRIYKAYSATYAGSIKTIDGLIESLENCLE